MGRSGGSSGRSSGGSHSHSSFHSHGSSHSHSSSRGSYSYSDAHPNRRYHHSSHNSHGTYDSYDDDYDHYSSIIDTYLPIKRIASFIILMIVVQVVMSISIMSYRSYVSGDKSIPASTVTRERIDTKNAYINDCIIDEIGWIQNENSLSRQLQSFYNATGCQPYIILREYDSTMNSEDAREAWTQEYYDTNFVNNQNVVLYVYFCDKGDNGYGDDTLWLGTDSSVIMDSEAVEIFWHYLDYNWEHWNINDNDGMFSDTFNRTADRIMTKTTTSNDVKLILIKVLGICFVVICIIIIVAKIIASKHKKAQETIAILNAPIEKLSDPASDLADKYNNQ